MWAGPAQLTRPDSALKRRWAGLGPKGIGPISPQQPSPLGLGRTRPDRRFGPESFWPITNISRPELVWPREEESLMGGGNYFPPPCLLYAERFCMQEAKKKHAI